MSRRTFEEVLTYAVGRRDETVQALNVAKTAKQFRAPAVHYPFFSGY